MRCSVRGCKNKTKRNETSKINYYCIPKDPELSKVWVEFCRRTKPFNPKTARICGDHFRAKDKERNLQYEMGFQKFKCPKLKPGTVPCIYKSVDVEDVAKKKDDLLSFPTVMLNEDSENGEESLSGAEEKNPCKDPLDAEEEKKKFNIKYVTLNGKQIISTAPAATIDKPSTDAQTPQPNFKGILAVLYPVDGTGKVVQNLLLDSSKKQGANVNSVPVPIKTDPNEDHLKIQKLINENELLKETEKRHKKQIRDLEISLMRSNFLRHDLEKKLKTLFSTNQIRRLRTGRRVIWSEKDMAQAVKLYQTSSAAYRLLKGQNYPLPALKSVQTWIQMCRQQLEEIENSTNLDEQTLEQMENPTNLDEQLLEQIENSTGLDEQQNDIPEECEIEAQLQNTENQNFTIPSNVRDHDYLLFVD